MNERWFRIALTILFVCSFTVLRPQSAASLVMFSQNSEESHGVVSPEDAHARKGVGKRMQELGYSPAEVKAKLDKLSREEIYLFANNPLLIQQGGNGGKSIAESEVAAVILLIVIIAGLASM